MIAPLLLLAAQVVVVRVDDVVDVPEGVVGDLSGQVARAISGRTKSDVRVVVGETDVLSEVVHLTLVGGISRLRLSASRRTSQGEIGRWEGTAPMGSFRWTTLIGELATQLFPDLGAIAPAIASAEPSADSGGGSQLLPWVLVGGGLVLAAVGGGFAASSSAIESDIEDLPRVHASLPELADRSELHRTVGISFVTAGLVAIACGVVLPFTD